ncbi:MHYT domain-containing protein [Paenibacillus silviterrae]|uniref:MHYT domain-containing protein n=1 Tax=Paenibacillus silviterrae TaxID=3242194 RepID=UPI0025436EEB|nr:MHYT domain-containing protein [Paenibacillus chinjuensis]
MEHLEGTYSWPLVILSVMISVFSSYCALELIERMHRLEGRARTLWLIIGSIAMGIGIWSMHFIGMLAFHLPVDVHYDIGLVVVSAVFPIIAALAALYVITGKARNLRSLLAGGLLMGVAISGMHYTGMASIQWAGTISYDPLYLVLSILVAIGISFMAMRLSFFYRNQRHQERHLREAAVTAKIGASLLLGCGIAAMHYIGMLAAQFSVDPLRHDVSFTRSSIHPMLLAVLIGAASLLLLIVFTVSLLLDRRFALRLAEWNQRRYDSIFEHHPDIVCLYDAKGRLQRVNPSAERITGYTQKELLGRPLSDFVDKTQLGRLRKRFEQVLKGQPQTIEFVFHHREGYGIHLNTTLVPSKAQGRIVDIYTISKDVTEQKNTEQAMLQAKLEAERAARIKSEFLAVMSHEIRTPLNGVISMSELLEESELGEEQREYAGIIGSSGRALLSVINDLLDFSKMDSGKVNLAEQPFDLIGSLEETVRFFQAQLQEERLAIRVSADPSIPEVLIGDIVRLRQVWINLIGNAVKFTAQGDIRIEVRERQRTSGHIDLEFTVKDSGIGIPEAEIPHLFQPFHQLDSSMARKHGGTGLGLAICKRIVEMMGGSIYVARPLGSEQGTTMVFTVKLGLAD